MAACRRVLQGLRHAQLLVRTSVGLLQRTSLNGFRFGAADSAEAWSTWGELEGRWSFVSRDVGWSAWSPLTSRGVHTTAWREDGEEGEDGEKRREFRIGGMKSLGGAKEREEVPAKVGNEEARNLVQQVHLASLRKKLRDDPRDTISYEELRHICRTVGMASNDEEATVMAHVFNQAGVVLTFRDKVHLHPEKIAELVANVLPLSLLGEDDQRRLELMALMEKKEAIDRKAHKQMRFVLWTGLLGLTVQVMVFIRLTYWELSWDVMEPIAFFATATGIICGYAYFMYTSRDPSYQDFMQRIYHSRQRKLFRKLNFDIKRFKELQMQCETGWKPLTKKILEDAD